MRYVFVLFLLALPLVSKLDARPLLPAPKTKNTVTAIAKETPWQNIAAGGAAAGTAIAAYKISDGIEEGIKTTAETHPEVIADTGAALALPVMLVLLIGGGVIGFFLLRILIRFLRILI